MLPYHNSECCLNILPQNVYSLWEKKVQCNEVRLLRYKFELLVFPFSAAFYFHTPELGIVLLTPLHLSSAVVACYFSDHDVSYLPCPLESLQTW